MSEPRPPTAAMLIASIIFPPAADTPESQELHGAISSLEEEFGPVDLRSPPLVFDHTAYYDREMGTPLCRVLMSFARLVERERLADIKLFTNALEKRHSKAGRRRVNIDPGLLTVENLILATGKNFTHRIYLQKGIYAEVTLIYQKGGFVTLPWTYPDYGSAEIRALLTAMRARLIASLKAKNHCTSA